MARICNIEFETKRKFYSGMEGFFSSITITDEDLPRDLNPLFRILFLRQTVHDYLTNIVVKFVHDRNDKDSPMLDFWRRIAGLRVAQLEGLGFAREYDRTPDKKRALRRVGSSISYAAMLINEDTAEQSFEEDITDVLSLLNGNHFYGFASDPITGELNLNAPPGYLSDRKRKAHQSKGVIDKLKEKKEE